MSFQQPTLQNSEEFYKTDLFCLPTLLAQLIQFNSIHIYLYSAFHNTLIRN